MMLHITNGDNANHLLSQSGIDGRFLAWADVLHDGPVPAQLTLHEMSLVRANFIHHCGWASGFEAQAHFQARDAVFTGSAQQGEVVIWNSPELYDQLHLLQLLSWYASSEGVECEPPEVVSVPLLLTAELSASELQQCFSERKVVTPQQLRTAEEAWYAFTSANPRLLTTLLRHDLSCLPYLKTAMERLLDEYPDACGVNRTERQALSTIASGIHQPAELFRAVMRQEKTPFMGDSSFWLVIQRMVTSDGPLIKTADASDFEIPGMFGPDEAFLSQYLGLTPLGEQVLIGEQDWLQSHQIDRWLGGVHLNPENRWRWDKKATEFLRR